MAGERFGQSIDIGKELEREEELLKKQEELDKKEPQTEQQEPASKEESLPASEETIEQEHPDETVEAQEHPDETAEEQEAPPKEQSPRDPLEEDINEIITKDIPVLLPKKTIWDRFRSYHVLILLVLVLLAGFWSLTRAADLPVIEQRAEQAVEKQLQVGIAQKIAKEWEFLSPKEKALKAARLYAERRKSPDIEQAIAKLTNDIKARYAWPDGLPYFFGIDPYYYYRLTRDRVEGGRTDAEPLASFQAFAFSFLNALTGWSLERALFFLPVFIGLGSLVVFFFIVRLVLGSSFPAVLASLVLAVHPLFVAGSGAGNPDTRAISLFLSLLFMLFFVSMCKWRGKKRIFSLLALLPAGWAFSKFLTILQPILGAQAFGFGIFLETFGILLFILALAGLGLLMRRIARKKATFFEGLLVVWAVASAGIVFWKPPMLLYALPAFIATVAVSADTIAFYVQRLIDWFVEHPAVLPARVGAGIVVSVIIMGGLWGNVRAEAQVLPVMNDGITETAQYVAVHSEPSAIITTGWTLGYLWEAAAERPVTLNIRNLSSPRLDMLAKAFVTSDEKLARNIIRSLDCNEPVSNESNCVLPEAFVIASQDVLMQLPLIDAIAQRDAGSMPEPNPDRVSDVLPCTGRSPVLRCSGYTVNLTSLDASSNGRHPAGLYVYQPAGRYTRAFEDAAVSYALVVMQGNDGFRAFMVDNDLAESMLVRWFAHDTSLKYFEPVFTVNQPDRIVTFSVAWNGRNITLQNIAPANTSASELSAMLAQSLKD